MPNKVLKGYVIGRERVPNEGSCRVNCYLNPDCVSINMGPLTEGELTCELSKATSGNEYSSHLEYQEDHTYLEIEVIRKNLHASSKWWHWASFRQCISPRGVLPYKRLMGMCRLMGSHFHNWVDYIDVGWCYIFNSYQNGVANFRIFWVRQF